MCVCGMNAALMQRRVLVRGRARGRKCMIRQARREWSDEMIFSNLVYVIASLVSFSCGQYFCAVSQLSAAIASSMFHRSHETKYLFVDAIVSSTLAIIFVYFALYAVKMEWYGVVTFKVLQGVICVFTWIYCGLPGGKRYDAWHKRWHYVSGCSTLSTSLYLSLYIPEFDLVLHQLAQEMIFLSDKVFY